MRTAQLLLTAAAIGAAAITLTACGSQAAPATTMASDTTHTYTVGHDIKAGTYVANQPLGKDFRCMWVVKSPEGLELGSDVTKDSHLAKRVLVLSDGQEVITGGCGTWTLT